MTDDPVEPLNAELRRLAAASAPRERRDMARTIAGALWAANAKRIRANMTPEGVAMEPRKSRLRPVRLGAGTAAPPAKRMFAKAPRMLRRRATEHSAELAFTPAAARIMAVHQYGLVDRVSPDSAATAAYPERPVLGISQDDRARILTEVWSRFE